MDVTEYIKRSREGDKAARDSVITANLGLVHMVAGRFEHRGHDREELFQIGCIGLLKAVDRFDVSLGVAFSTYAVPMITGEIRRFLRDDGMVRVSRGLKETGYKIARMREKLTAETGKEPGVRELADALGMTPEDIVLAGEANRVPDSIDRLVWEEDGREACIDRLLPVGMPGFDEEPAKENFLNRMMIGQLLETLEEDERELIQLRYYENRTQSETAKRLKTTQVQISRMEKKVLRKLREQSEIST